MTSEPGFGPNSVEMKPNSMKSVSYFCSCLSVEEAITFFLSQSAHQAPAVSEGTSGYLRMNYKQHF